MESGYIVVLGKKKISRPYELDQGKHTIGGSVDSNIRLKFFNPLLLDTHAIIRVNHLGVATVINKSTAAPVKVNGKTAFKPTILRHKDTFQVLEKEFQYFNENLKDVPEESEIFVQEKKKILADRRKSVMPLSKTPAKVPTYKIKSPAQRRMLNKSLGASLTKSASRTNADRTPRANCLNTTFSHNSTTPTALYETPKQLMNISKNSNQASKRHTHSGFEGTTKPFSTIKNEQESLSEKNSNLNVNENVNLSMSDESEESAISLRLSSDSLEATEARSSLASSLTEDHIPATQVVASRTVFLNEASKISTVAPSRASNSVSVSQNISPSISKVEQHQSVMSLPDNERKSPLKRRSTSFLRNIGSDQGNKFLNTSRRISKRRSFNTFSLSKQGSTIEHDSSLSVLRQSRSAKPDVSVTKSSVFENSDTDAPMQNSIENASGSIMGDQLPFSSQNSTIENSQETSINIGSSSRSFKGMETFDESTQEAKFNSSKRKTPSHNSKCVEPVGVLDDSDEIPATQYDNESDSIFLNESRKESEVTFDKGTILNSEHHHSVLSLSGKGRTSALKRRSTSFLQKASCDIGSNQGINKSFSTVKRLSKRHSVTTLSLSKQGSTIRNDPNLSVLRQSHSVREDMVEVKQNISKGSIQSFSAEDVDHSSSSQISTVQNSRENSTVNSRVDTVSGSISKCMGTFDESTQDAAINFNGSTDKLQQSKTSISEKSTKDNSKRMKPINISDDSVEILSPVQPFSSRKMSQDNNISSNTTGRRSCTRRSLKGQKSDNSSLTTTSLDQSTGSVISVSSQSFSSYKKGNGDLQNDPGDDTEIDVVNFTVESNTSEIRKSVRFSVGQARTPAVEERQTRRSSSAVHMFADVTCTSTPFHKPFVNKDADESSTIGRPSRATKSSTSSMKTPESKVLTISSTDVTINSPKVERSRSASLSVVDNSYATNRRRSSRSSTFKIGEHNCISCRHSSVKRSRSLSVASDVSKVSVKDGSSIAKSDTGTSSVENSANDKAETTPISRRQSVVEDETPKSHVKPARRSSKANRSTYNPVLEDITPVTPEKLQVSGFTETFKTPINTPGLFESIRKSVVRSRKRRRDSSGSISKNTKRARMEHTNENQESQTPTYEVAKLMKTRQKSPKNDLTNVSGVANMFNVSGGSDIENSEDLFTKLTGKRPVRAYHKNKSLSPAKANDIAPISRKTMGDLPVCSPRVQRWVDEHVNYNVSDQDRPSFVDDSETRESKKRKRGSVSSNKTDSPHLNVSEKPDVTEKSSRGVNRRSTRWELLGTTPNENENPLQFASLERKRRVRHSMSPGKVDHGEEKRRKTQWDSVRGTPDENNWIATQKSEENNFLQSVECASEQPGGRPSVGYSLSPGKNNQRGGKCRTQGDNLKGAPYADMQASEGNYILHRTPTDQVENGESVSEQPSRKPRVGHSISPGKNNQIVGLRRKTQWDNVKGSPNVDNWVTDQASGENDLLQDTSTDQMENSLESVSDQPNRKPRVGRSMSPKKNDQREGLRRKTQWDNMKGTPDVDNWVTKQASGENDLLQDTSTDQMENSLGSVSDQPNRKPRVGRSMSPKKNDQREGLRRKTQWDNMKGTPDVDNWVTKQASGENDLLQDTSTDQMENSLGSVSDQPNRKPRVGRSMSPKKNDQREGLRRKTQWDNMKGTPDVDNWVTKQASGENDLLQDTSTDQMENSLGSVSDQPNRKPRVGRSMSPKKNDQREGLRRKTQWDNMKGTPDVDNWVTKQASGENDLLQDTSTDHMENSLESVPDQPNRKPRVGHSMSPKKNDHRGGLCRETQWDNLKGTPDVDNWVTKQASGENDLLQDTSTDQMENSLGSVSDQPNRKPRVGRSMSPKKNDQRGGLRRKTQWDNVEGTPDISNWKSNKKSNMPVTEEDQLLLEPKRRLSNVISEKIDIKARREEKTKSDLVEMIESVDQTPDTDEVTKVTQSKKKSKRGKAVASDQGEDQEDQTPNICKLTRGRTCRNIQKTNIVSDNEDIVHKNSKGGKPIATDQRDRNDQEKDQVNETSDINKVTRGRTRRNIKEANLVSDPKDVVHKNPKREKPITNDQGDGNDQGKDQVNETPDIDKVSRSRTRRNIKEANLVSDPKDVVHKNPKREKPITNDQGDRNDQGKDQVNETPDIDKVSRSRTRRNIKEANVLSDPPDVVHKNPKREKPITNDQGDGNDQGKDQVNETPDIDKVSRSRTRRNIKEANVVRDPKDVVHKNPKREKPITNDQGDRNDQEKDQVNETPDINKVSRSRTRRNIKEANVLSDPKDVVHKNPKRAKPITNDQGDGNDQGKDQVNETPDIDKVSRSRTRRNIKEANVLSDPKDVVHKNPKREKPITNDQGDRNDQGKDQVNETPDIDKVSRSRTRRNIKEANVLSEPKDVVHNNPKRENPTTNDQGDGNDQGKDQANETPDIDKVSRSRTRRNIKEANLVSDPKDVVHKNPKREKPITNDQGDGNDQGKDQVNETPDIDKVSRSRTRRNIKEATLLSDPKDVVHKNPKREKPITNDQGDGNDQGKDQVNETPDIDKVSRSRTRRNIKDANVLSDPKDVVHKNPKREKPITNDQGDGNDQGKDQVNETPDIDKVSRSRTRRNIKDANVLSDPKDVVHKNPKREKPITNDQGDRNDQGKDQVNETPDIDKVSRSRTRRNIKEANVLSDPKDVVHKNPKREKPITNDQGDRNDQEKDQAKQTLEIGKVTRGRKRENIKENIERDVKVIENVIENDHDQIDVADKETKVTQGRPRRNIKETNIEIDNEDLVHKRVAKSKETNNVESITDDKARRGRKTEKVTENSAKNPDQVSETADFDKLSKPTPELTPRATRAKRGASKKTVHFQCDDDAKDIPVPTKRTLKKKK